MGGKHDPPGGLGVSWDRIARLPADVIDQIAAGEVVERPASVVKELVENALDAEASRIEVEIAAGGIRRVQVRDDGIGMSERDARLAFERHATSKIRTAEDLSAVTTLGFRGEALASIAAVAEVRLRTCPPGESSGTEVRVSPGRAPELAACGTPPGTRIEISELFASIPARRKFLRSESTESLHVLRWLERAALARPDVGFSLARDDRRVLDLYPTRELRERVIAVVPAGQGERLLAVDAADGAGALFGFASPTDLMRGDTAELHLFVNGRPVRDPLLLGAVREAYRDALPPGRHPVVVLFLRIDPAGVDVNVHPAKSEVRFRDPAGVRALVRHGLMRAIGRRAAPYGASSIFDRQPVWGPATARDPAPLATERGLLLPWPEPSGSPLPFGPHAGGSRPAFRSHEILGQALGTYLVLARDDAIVLLDQHAAHERVLFERMRQALLQGGAPRQQQLVPIWAELSPSACEALQKGCGHLEQAGLELEIGELSPRGAARVAIRAIPAALAAAPIDWAALLEETAAALRAPEQGERREGLDAALHAICASAACHAALRKGDRIAPAEIRALLEALDELLWVPNCPHGRPIAHTLERAELERRFLRR